MSNVPQSPPKLEILQLGAENTLSKFNCGQRAVDKWATRSAHKLHVQERHKVYVVREVGGITPLAFLSLSLSHQQPSKLMSQDDRDRWQLGAPFLFVDWLGVSRSLQKQGVGGYLLAFAMEKTWEIHAIAPVYGLALRSIGPETTPYYEKRGFKMAPGENPKNSPLLILPIFTIKDLFRQT